MKFDSIIPQKTIEQFYTNVNEFNAFTPAFELDSMYSKEVDYLEEVKTYANGWDSYDGLAPNGISIQKSIQLLANFKRIKEKLNYLLGFPEVCLSPDGFLGFEWDYAKGCNFFARVFPESVEVTLIANDRPEPRQDVKYEEFNKFLDEKLAA